MGENLERPYRVTRAERPDSPSNPTADATAALAHRLRMAAQTAWDGDRCDTEATLYVTELTNRGWTPPPTEPRHRPTPADPSKARQAAEQARAAIRANRPDHDTRAPVPPRDDEQGTPVPQGGSPTHNPPTGREDTPEHTYLPYPGTMSTGRGCFRANNNDGRHPRCDLPANDPIHTDA